MRIVEGFQRRGDIVAVTGDGVIKIFFFFFS